MLQSSISDPARAGSLTTTAEAASEHQAENKVFILFISLVATIGGFLFGFDSGVINGTVDGLQQAFNSQSAGFCGVVYHQRLGFGDCGHLTGICDLPGTRRFGGWRGFGDHAGLYL
jgi:hypothetical protein